MTYPDVGPDMTDQESTWWLMFTTSTPYDNDQPGIQEIRGALVASLATSGRNLLKLEEGRATLEEYPEFIIDMMKAMEHEDR